MDQTTSFHSLYGEGKVYNDYGLGFYCTENADAARERDVKKQKDGYLNRYEIDLFIVRGI